MTRLSGSKACSPRVGGGGVIDIQVCLGVEVTACWHRTAIQVLELATCRRCERNPATPLRRRINGRLAVELQIIHTYSFRTTPPCGTQQGHCRVGKWAAVQRDILSADMFIEHQGFNEVNKPRPDVMTNSIGPPHVHPKIRTSIIRRIRVRRILIETSRLAVGHRLFPGYGVSAGMITAISFESPLPCRGRDDEYMM